MIALPDRDSPVVVTERLELWLPSAADMAEMIAIVSSPVTGRFLGPSGSRADHFARFQRNAGSWLLHGYGSFIVREKGASDAIGNCGVFHSYRGLGEDFDDKPEAGWIIAADHVGKGYAGEAMRAALDWFEHEHGRQEIVCMIEPGNEPSFALAAKLGFVEMRQAQLPDGGDVVLLKRSPVSC